MTKRLTLGTETKRAVKALIITLSLMIIALGAVFLITTSESAQKGYVLQQEKLRNEHLRSLNAGLTTQITQATAFSQIEDSEKVEEMEEVEKKNYVTSEDNSVE